MNDDDLCRSMDTSTLLTLMLVLEEEIRRAGDTVRMAGEQYNNDVESGAQIHEQMDELIMLFENRRTGEPDVEESTSKLQAKIRAARDSVTSSLSEQFLFAAMEHSSALMKRRWAVHEELERRGMLPKFPELPEG